ncbi:MAG: alpha/beta fold hydrolase [Pseudobdellovibrionaceae bacterium]
MSRKISFREVGQGPVLILLHGYGGSVMHWDGVRDRLAGSFRVVVPNLSHLFLTADKIFFSVQVEILAQFIRQHFPDQKVHLAGTSYSGALTWALALQHSSLVEKIILINPVVPHPQQYFLLPELKAFLKVPFATQIIYMMLATSLGKSFLNKAAVIFRDERVSTVERLRGRKLMFVAQMISHFAWILKQEDWNLWQKKMKEGYVRSLVIFDREDLLFDSSAYLQFAQDLNAEKVQEITGAGHLAIKTRPETIAKWITDFIQPVQISAAAEGSAVVPIKPEIAPSKKTA